MKFNHSNLIKLAFFILLFLLHSPFIIAQKAPVKIELTAKVEVTGQIIGNDSNEPIPYTTLTIKNDSAKVISRLATDINGYFSVMLDANKKYQLDFTSVGYKVLHKQLVLTTNLKEPLGKMEMKAGVNLKEVEVVTQKPLIKSDIDKITYSIEADPESQSTTLLEMLRKVPLITVDGEENIKVNGQSNFKVLMNGKSSSMMNGSLKDILKSIPANTIKNIEVITNPSSKYEAEGVGGIINIITNKNGIDGIMGNVSLNGTTWGGYGGSAYLSAKIGKLTLSGRYNGNNNKRPGYTNEFNGNNYISDAYRYSSGKSNNKGIFYNQGGSGEASYELDSLNLFTASFWVGNYKQNLNSYSLREEFNKDSLLSRSYENTGIYHFNNNYLSGNIDYQRSFNKPDKTFTLSYKIDNNGNNSISNTELVNICNFRSYSQYSDDKANGLEQTLQADYYDPLTKNHQIETGFKYILRMNNSDGAVSLFNQSNGNADSLRTTTLNYTQHILGIYAGYLFKHKNINVKAGIRLETSYNSAKFRQQRDTTFATLLFNPVPYINISYKIDSLQNIRLSYTQRLSRPGIWYLNPYINDTDPMNLSSGNPDLSSEISHSISLNYSRFSEKYNLSASISGALMNNGIEQIQTINENGVKYSKYENGSKQQNIRASLYGSVRFTPKINLYLNFAAGYNKVQSLANAHINNEGFSYNGYMGFNWTAWKKGTINFSGGFSSDPVSLQSKTALYYYTSFGVRQLFYKDKFTVSLFVSNPFTHEIKYKAHYFIQDQYDMNYITRFPNREFRISVAYNFGKMSKGGVKKVRRGIENDDLKAGGKKE